MKIRYWITTLILVVVLIATLPVSLDSYSKRDSIRRASSADFLQTISKTLGQKNTHFDTSSLSVKDVRFVDDSLAIVKILNTRDALGGYVVFELHDNTLSITNYSGTSFMASDFRTDSSVVRQIISISSEM